MRKILLSFSGNFKIQKISLVFFMLFVLSETLSAAPYFGQTVKLKQPDGTRVEVRVWGDEFYQDVESLDGYTLARDPDTGWITYAELSADGNEYVSTGIKYNPKKSFSDAVSAAGNTAAASRAYGMKKKLRIKKESRMDKIRRVREHFSKYRSKAAGIPSVQTALGKAAPGASAPRPPVYSERTGSYKGLTIIIDFSDVPANMARSEISNCLNQAGYTGFGNKGSVRDFFRDISGNKLDYTNTVTEYYRAAHEKSYYTDEDVSYGERAVELVTEAVAYLASAGFDFSGLSVENNEVMALNVLYAGEIDNAWSKGLWPHSFGIPPYYIPGTQNFLGKYEMTNIGSEMIIGTFCHENGHMLMGWPDLYDYGYESAGAGSIDLMSGGNWNGNGRDPIGVNAFFRHTGGWDDVTDLGADTRNVFYHAANSNTSYRYQNQGKASESFYVESRRITGRYDTMPGEGLLIWHVDWTGNNDNEQMTDAQHYLVSLEQADGRFDMEYNRNGGDAADFYFQGNNADFNNNSLPDSRWWNNSSSGLNIGKVSAISDNMSFELAAPPSRKLNLQVRNAGQDSCSSNVFSEEIRIVNNDNSPVDIDTLKVKMWFYSPGAVNINGCWGGQVNGPSGNYLGGVNSTASSVSLPQACTVEAGRRANSETTISFASTMDIPANGGYAQGMNLQMYRGSWLSPFDDNCDDYTKNGAASFHENMYVALYENGALVDEWVSPDLIDANTGREPCAYQPQTPMPTLTGTKTPVPTNTASPAITPTRTRTIIVTPTRTGTTVFTYTRTRTPVIAATITATRTRTQAQTVIATATRTRTQAQTAIATATRTRTQAQTAIATATRTQAQTVVATPTRTQAQTVIASATRTSTRAITPTYTRTVFVSPTSTATTGQSAVRIQYYTSSIQENSNSLYVNMKIINDGQLPLNLQDVTAKYWYTFEGSTGADVVENDYSVTYPGGLNLNPYVVKGVQAISQGGQNRVMTAGFTSGAGSIPAGGYVTLQMRIHKDNWSDFTQSTDYSFGMQTAYQDWTKITGYVSGVKVWGIEPGGLSSMADVKEPGGEVISQENAYNYPNPCSDVTTIRFSLSRPVRVRISICDAGGNPVKAITLGQNETRAGINSVDWDLNNDHWTEVSNGVYLAKIEAEGMIITKKIAVVR